LPVEHIPIIPEIATPLMAKVSKTLDMMLGSHLDAHWHMMGKFSRLYYISLPSN
jgi:hypothetical protein